MHGPTSYSSRTALPRRAARAFSLVELLVVIAVIGLLIAAVVGVANVAVHNQKVRNTHAIMKNLTLAIDQFKEEDPLRLVYNGKHPTFGPYPPYQVAGDTTDPTCVAGALDPFGSLPGSYVLANRLHRDLGNRQGSLDNWVWLSSEGTQGGDDTERTNDDIRALYTYLAVYMPSGLSQVPENALQPLTADHEWINTAGNGELDSATKRVLGIHDAWGVPLDYLLYVKVEWGVRADGTVGVKITDRVAVLRSRGISREVYDVQQRDRDPDLGRQLSAKWIFSTEFPSPAADATNTAFWQNGVFTGDQDDNGWARAVALAEDYGYVPDPKDGTPP